MKESVRNAVASVHYMLYDSVNPVSALDFIGMPVHTFSNTHIDATVHVNWEGQCYNGKKIADILTPQGLTWGGIESQRDGLFTRGVLLDVCAVRGVEYLDRNEFIYSQDLEKAERLAGVKVGSGDCIFVNVGLQAREKKEGIINPAEGIAGIHAEVLSWLHKREVAVWSGDCVEKLPYPSKRFPLPMHMIGLPAMGLVQLDIPDMEGLCATSRSLGRFTFLVTAAPLFIKGASGSPINPVLRVLDGSK